jgi:hypothetical protein
MPRIEALTRLCPDLESWPQHWRGDDSDIAVGERIVECFTSFLLHLLEQQLAMKTLQRHRDHLCMLGGEIIRRLHEESELQHTRTTSALILRFIDPDCGPLMWPRITEQQQNSFDATCRKLYQFLVANRKATAR